MGTRYKGSRQERLALDAYTKLIRAADTVAARAQRHLCRWKITASQFGALEALYHLGPLCPSVLAQKLLKSDGNLTVVIDNLQRRGWARRVRDAQDRRFLSVQLTPAGRRLVERIFPEHVGQIVRAVGPLSCAQLEQMGRLCRAVGKRVHR